MFPSPIISLNVELASNIDISSIPPTLIISLEA